MTEPLLEKKLDDDSPAFFKSASAYARDRGGVSRTVASRWNKAGLLIWVVCQVTGRKVIDAAASDQARATYQNQLKRVTPAPAAVSKDADPVPAGDPELPLDSAKPAPAAEPDPLVSDARAAQTKLVEARAARESIGLDRDLGLLVPKEAQRLAAARRAAALQDALMKLPLDLAEDANPENPALARTVIAAGIRKLCLKFVEDERARLASGAVIDYEDDGAEG